MKQRAVPCSMVLLALVFGADSLAKSQTAQAVLASAAAAFSQGKPVNGITLNATAEWIAGSDNETGNATLTASSDGSYTVQLQLAQSSRTEAQNSFSSGQSCTWSGTDGISHPVAAHNCMGSVAWFLPYLSLFGTQQPSSVSTVLEGSVAGAATQMLDIRQQRTPQTALSSDIAPLFTHLSTVDLFLDPVSYLPRGLRSTSTPTRTPPPTFPCRLSSPTTKRSTECRYPSAFNGT